MANGDNSVQQGHFAVRPLAGAPFGGEVVLANDGLANLTLDNKSMSSPLPDALDEHGGPVDANHAANVPVGPVPATSRAVPSAGWTSGIPGSSTAAVAA